jgi:nucleolar GTP-binding protein
LLAARVDFKLRGNKINEVINRIHLAEPIARDDIPRTPFIPEQVKGRPTYDMKDPKRRKLERDLEAEGGGPGVFSVDLKSEFEIFYITGNSFIFLNMKIKYYLENYLLKNDEWKYDAVPEIMDGKNIIDFVDPDIAEKLDALEREEQKLEAEGYYDSVEEMVHNTHCTNVYHFVIYLCIRENYYV